MSLAVGVLHEDDDGTGDGIGHQSCSAINRARQAKGDHQAGRDRAAVVRRFRSCYCRTWPC